MSTELDIQAFKCFESISLELEKLTVLCGPNSGGKSSIVQALLLHSYATAASTDQIPVNGPFGLQLGDAESLQNRASHSEAEEGFSITFDGQAITYVPEVSPRVLKTIRTGRSNVRPTIFLSAERNGPRLSQEAFSNQSDENLNVGYAGQFTAEVLVTREREHVREALRPGEVDSLILLGPVVEHYLSLIFGPIQVQARANGNTPPSLYFKRPGVEEDWSLAAHTGFGITYVLPVIVAGLLAAEGSTFVVDSPEAHLHPAAQTELAKFLVRLAGSGVTVVVETHSDYVIEGVRIAVAAQGLLPTKDCVIYSIELTEEGIRSATALMIESDGKISDWPKGFFDQHVINMRSLLVKKE